MRRYRLELQLSGSFIAHVGPRQLESVNEPDRRRYLEKWTEMELFQTETGRLLLSIVKRRRRGDNMMFVVVADSWEHLGTIFERGKYHSVLVEWSDLTRRLIERASEKIPEAASILPENWRGLHDQQMP